MRRIGVIGLGYVGLPVAVAFARRFPGTCGFDRDPARIEALRAGCDRTRAVEPEALTSTALRLCDRAAELADCDFYVVTVPTPIDRERRPDFEPLEAASRTVGSMLRRGDVVVFESTVYPGVTEERCGALLAGASGLRPGRDFGLAYSPERINPGDPDHTFERTVKVVAASDPDTLALVARCYEEVVPAGVHRVSSIRVAEGAKVIENVQRDLNIALMNELAVLFDRLGLDTREVLDAAATKWNFQRYHPGLVGGHCIGVDPYYLTTLAESVGIYPRVMLAGRRVNDEMSDFVAQRTLALLADAGRPPAGARVGVLGLAFKPDVPDTRNSRVPALVRVLREAGATLLCHDPLADPAEVAAEHGLELLAGEELEGLDALVLATPHRELRGAVRRLLATARPPAVLVDVLGALDPRDVPPGVTYWCL